VSEDRVRVGVEAGVAHVRLDRPDKRNGLDLPMFRAIVAAGERLAADPAVRAVVLSGEGKAFCAGLDWGAFLAMGADAAQLLLARDEKSPANLAQRVAWVWREVPLPVIAALHGAVFGGGLQVALGADLRIAAPDTQLSAMEVRYGLVPDMGLSQTLPRLVRADVAKDLVFTGRTVGADEALAIGLVTRLAADPLAAALETARAIAANSPDAVRAAKRLLDAPNFDVAASLRRETELQLGLMGSPNQLEAVAAVFGKRSPVFRDPR
jgi:enoyl-CoA hydratase/carnithine racemase